MRPEYYHGQKERKKEIMKERGHNIPGLIASFVVQFGLDCRFYLGEVPTRAGEFKTAEMACMNLGVSVEYAEQYRPRDVHPITLEPLDMTN